MIRNAKVILGEECVHKHQLLAVDIKFRDQARPGRKNYEPHLRTWKLQDERCRNDFVEVIRERQDEVGNAEGINDKWNSMKNVWIKAAEEVLSKTSAPPRHKETWW